MENNTDENSVDVTINEKEKTFKKKGIVLASLTIILILIAAVCYVYYGDSSGYLLRINGEEISESKFDTYLKWQMGYMQANSEEEIVWDNIEEVAGVPYIELAKELTVQLLTETTIQLQQAKKRDISLIEEEKTHIDAAVRQQLIQNDELAQYDLTAEEWIEINLDAQIIDKLVIAILNEDFTPYDASHILFLTTDAKTDEEKEVIRNKAQGILDRVVAGEDFATLAKEYSQDGSASNGGLYTGVAKGAFVPEFETAALSLKDGEIYPELVESTYGYHIIKLEKKLSDKKITEITSYDMYYSYLNRLQEWEDGANVEKGAQFILVGKELE